MPSISEEKSALRREILNKRAAMRPSYHADKSKRIVSSVISSSHFAECEKILLYYPINKEVDILPLFRASLCSGKKVYFPRVEDDGSMTFRRVSSLSELKKGAFSIPSPSAEAETLCNLEKALAVIPSVALSKSFRRIGYGAGFYDRYFADRNGAFLLGVAFEMQIIDFFTADEHDIVLDAIMSECSILYNNQKGELS